MTHEELTRIKDRAAWFYEQTRTNGDHPIYLDMERLLGEVERLRLVLERIST